MHKVEHEKLDREIEEIKLSLGQLQISDAHVSEA